MAQPAKRTRIASQRGNGSARRGRPTGERTAAIEVAIRENALALFLDVGFDSASMEAIALRAGISKGTLYARYKDKEQLFRAVLEDELQRWSKRAGERNHLLPDELAPRLRHHARILQQVFEWPEYKRIARLIEAAAPSLPGLSKHWEEIGTKRYLEFLACDMAKAAGGEDIDWDFFAKLFLFSISGWKRAGGAARSACDDEIVAFADKVVGVIRLAITRA